MQGIIEKLSGLYDWLTTSISIQQALIAAAILLALVIVLLVVSASKDRRYEEDVEQIKDTHTAEKKRLEQALRDKEAEIDALKAAPPPAPEPVDEPAEISPRVIVAEEARRIISDAKAQAHSILQQADQEYLELVTRAHDEAEFLRKKANERILHANESMKNTLVRSGEIIEEAYAEISGGALRISAPEDDGRASDKA